MAVLVPGVEHRLLGGKSTVPLDARVITVHTMAGTMAGTEAFFAPARRPYSHFGLAHNGRIRQWQDLRFRAGSDRFGNPFTISIETEDKGGPFPPWSHSDVPRWTPEQVSSLVVLLSWLCHRFGLPRRAIGSSCPHERGIGWHRFGIDPWRNPNCPSWTTSRGKACPGDRRIHQLIHEIIPQVSSSPEVDEVTPDDHNKIKASIGAAVRSEVQRLGQYLAAGESNQAFNPQAQTWMKTATTLAKLRENARGESQRLGQFLTTGASNQAFDPQVQTWMKDAATMATLKALVEGDHAELARQALASMSAEDIAAAIPDAVAQAVAAQLAARVQP